MHAPVQAALQQTPWAQCPDLHSLSPEHWAGGSLRPQEPFTQVLGGAHWLLFWQLVKQVVLPLQA